MNFRQIKQIQTGVPISYDDEPRYSTLFLCQPRGMRRWSCGSENASILPVSVTQLPIHCTLSIKCRVAASSSDFLQGYIELDSN